MRKLEVFGLLTWRFIMLHMRVRLRRSAHLRIVKINSCLRFAQTVALESDPPKSSAISTACLAVSHASKIGAKHAAENAREVRMMAESVAVGDWQAA